jgi:hypothetical protein
LETYGEGRKAGDERNAELLEGRPARR